MQLNAIQFIDPARLRRLESMGVDTTAWWYERLLAVHDGHLPVVFEEEPGSLAHMLVCKQANLFSLPRAARGVMCEGYYRDIDAQSAHPAILIHLFNIAGMTPPEVCVRWARDRSGLVAELFPDMDPEDAKERLLKFLNSDSYHAETTPHALKVLHYTIYNGPNSLLKKIQPLLPEVSFAVDPKETYNLGGKAFSQALRYFTKKMLQACIQLSFEHGLVTDLACHDGWMVRVDPPPPADFLQLLTERVKREVGGLEIHFKYKPHDLSLLSVQHAIQKRVKLAPPPNKPVVTCFKLAEDRVSKVLGFLKGGGKLPVVELDYADITCDEKGAIKYLLNAQKGKTLTINYSAPTCGIGRLAAKPKVNLGTLPAPLRAFLVDGDMVDVDVKVCGCTILRYLLRLHQIQVPYILNLWCDDRAGAMAALNVTCKRTMDRVGDTDKPNADRRLNTVYEAVFKTAFLERLGWPEGASTSFNARGRWVGLQIRDVERRALLAAVKPHRKVLAMLLHDGFLLPADHAKEPDFLQGCSDRVKQIMPTLDLTFRVKPNKRDLGWESLLAG